MTQPKRLSALLNTYLGIAIVIGIILVFASVAGLNVAYKKVLTNQTFDDLESLFAREQSQLTMEFVNSTFYAMYLRGQILEKEYLDKSLTVNLSKVNGTKLYSSKAFDSDLGNYAKNYNRGIFINKLGEEFTFIRKKIAFGGEDLGEVIFSASLSNQHNPILSQTLYTTIIVILITILAMFLSLKLFLTRNILEPLGDLLAHLPTHFAYARGEKFNISEFKNVKVAEIQELESAVRQLSEHSRRTLLNEERVRKSAEKEKALNEVAAQVAHDIRSPLSAINVVLNTPAVLTTLSPQVHLLLESAAKRIQEIAANLMEKRKPLRSLGEVSNLVSLTREIVEEKRTEINRSDIFISFNDDDCSTAYYSKVVPSEFKRIISNILNNSIEAIPKNSTGKISIYLSCSASYNELKIVDNGKGIPSNLLNKVFEQGVSFGKETGTGLGLYHAKKVVNDALGEIEIHSAKNVGTTLTVLLPRTDAPEHVVSTFKLAPEFKNIVIIDDDPLVHETWRAHFGKAGLKFEHYLSCEDFLEKNDISNTPKDSTFFFCDYNFLHKRTTGLEFLIEYGLAKNSLLVTNLSDNADISEVARTNSIKIMPKYLIEKVQFHEV